MSNVHGYAQRLNVEGVICQDTTKNQKIEIFDTTYFGRALALDGIIQLTEKDEHFYHEMLAHVPIISHGAIRDALIIGGGDGGTLREICRHKDISSITLVEIDKRVIELCKDYLPKISNGAFDDQRTSLIIGDGAEYLTTSGNLYDLIIIDSTDPIGPSLGLFTKEFYKNCKKALKKKGILISQSGVPFFQGEEFLSVHQSLSTVFVDSTFYLTVVPTYVGGFIALGWSSDYKKHRSVDAGIIKNRFEAIGIETRYYSPEMHQASFCLPPFIAEILVDK